MSAATSPHEAGFAGACLEPAAYSAFQFDQPADVLNDCTLTREEKRTILSAWASDAWAVASSPGLRWLPGTTTAVPIDTILNALNQLDDPPGPRPGGAVMRLPRYERMRTLLRGRINRMTRRYLERHVFRPPDEINPSARAA